MLCPSIQLYTNSALIQSDHIFPLIFYKAKQLICELTFIYQGAELEYVNVFIMTGITW